MLRHFTQGHVAPMWGAGMPAWLAASEAHALFLLLTADSGRVPGLPASFGECSEHAAFIG